MADSTVVLPLPSLQTDYGVYLRHHGRWIRAASTHVLHHAETMAEESHRRSNLPIEIRDADGNVVTAFDPPSLTGGREWSGVALV